MIPVDLVDLFEDKAQKVGETVPDIGRLEKVESRVDKLKSPIHKLVHDLVLHRQGVELFDLLEKEN